MRLLEMTGALRLPDLDADGMLVLVATAERMLRGGVTLTPDYWASLDEAERTACVVANSRLRAEQAAMTGLSAFGPRQAAEVLAVADGGAFLSDLKRALDRELLRMAAATAPTAEESMPA